MRWRSPMLSIASAPRDARAGHCSESRQHHQCGLDRRTARLRRRHGYAASKFAVSGLTECWRAELRKHNIRVMQINPSEVQTDFVVASGRPARPMSELPDRGFIPEVPVWATNPD